VQGEGFGGQGEGGIAPRAGDGALGRRSGCGRFRSRCTGVLIGSCAERQRRSGDLGKFGA